MAEGSSGSGRPGAAPGEGDGDALPGGLPRTPECPFCRESETELMNAFGAHASVSTYWCRACRSPFELMRWRGEAGRGGESR